MRSATWVAIAAAACVAWPLADARGGDVTALSYARGDVDLASCRTYRGGVAKRAPARDVLAALGLGESFDGRDGLSAGRIKGWGAKERFEYLIAFERPVAAGTVWFGTGELRILKDGAPYPGDPNDASHWVAPPVYPRQTYPRAATLPPGTRVRSLLVTERRGRGVSSLRLLRVSAGRYHNLTPVAVANGEAEYTRTSQFSPPYTYAAASITGGWGAWQSHGPEGDTRRVARAPLTDVTPSWFVLSWDEPVRICGIVSRDNFTKLQLYTFVGPSGVNPATAMDHEWERLRAAGSSRASDGSRWFAFAPVETRGVKLLISGSQDERFARIDGLAVVTDLGRAAVPAPPSTRDEPPFEIAYRVERPGRFSMVVDDHAGRRVRNLVGREKRDAGAHAEHWDLKDEGGAYVAPGTYRWKGVYQPATKLVYQMTPYPNITTNAPGNSPWLNGHSGPGGWLADHSNPGCVVAAGERVYFGAGCAESGVAFIECDLSGRKLWGHHNFAAWTGPQYLAADDRSVYLAAPRDRVWAVDRSSHETRTVFEKASTTTRRRGVRGLACRDGELYVSVRADASWLTSAASGDDVDITRCLPLYPPLKETNDHVDPDPRTDFKRLFRLQGTPPGNGHGKGFLTWLESTDRASSRNHIVLAFKRDVPLGSFAFPFPEKKVKLRLSCLRRGGAYPPDARDETDWKVFWEGAGAGWTVVPGPEGARTRALRITFDEGADDLDALMEDDDGLGMADLLGSAGARGGKRWRLEGMKLLRRRYRNLYASAKVRVSSGSVNARGEWDARRPRPLSESDPGIYVLQWRSTQKVRGLALEEIDGKRTEIDVFTGAGPPGDIRSSAGWEHVATYEQPLRYYYHPDVNHNSRARYVDGYVDFGREIETRAVRLRVVEQWTTKKSGRAGCSGVRDDRGGSELDPTRCRIYGVAPVQYLGGEPPVDPMVAERIEVYEAATGKMTREFHVPEPGRIAVGPRGALHAISGRAIVTVDRDGATRPFVTDLERPEALAFDRSGGLYVFDRGASRRNVRVYDASGRYVRSIGTPGGRKAGPWDPTTFTSGEWVRVDVSVDARGQLWVVENDNKPKRISRWTTAGEFQADYFGNTSYGGGGCLDPQDTSRLFYRNMEFALDWRRGTTRLARITWLGDSPAGEVPIRVGGRTYLVTRPLFRRQQCGVVYLDEGDAVKRVAAVGLANGFPPLRKPEIEATLGENSLNQLQFMWTDRNGDGDAQVGEVVFSPRRIESVSWFNRDLSLLGGGSLYEVERFLPGGAPVYRESKSPGDGAGVRLSNGTFLFMYPFDKRSPLHARDAAGETIWSWETEGFGTHAYARAKPYHDAQMVALFDIIGVGRTRSAGGLGEFVVTNSNAGTFHVMTADGILCGRVFRELRDPKRTGWSMREHERGMDLTDVTAGQEHFSGYFCTAADGKQYVVAGHNHVSVVEVKGLEGFRRSSGAFEVTADDVRRVQQWERRRQQRAVYKRAAVIRCGKPARTIVIDGEIGDWHEVPVSRIDDRISFRMAYDGGDELYVCYHVEGLGPLTNTGVDWRKYYKAGAAVDLQIGADPAADERRRSPVAGDQRLLMTVVRGRPVAVSYRPTDPGAPKSAAWGTHTMVFKAHFDSVRRRGEVRMAHAETEGGYVLEAAVPLSTLGLRVTPKLRLRMDWGVLDGGPDGNQTLRRIYWSNKSTNIVSDEAAEAQIHPELWGHVVFGVASSGAAGAQDIDSVLDSDEDDDDVDDLLDLEL